MTSALLRLLMRNELRNTFSRPVVIFWTMAFPVLYLAVLAFAFGRPGSLGTVQIQIIDSAPSSASQRYVRDVKAFLSSQEAVQAEFPPAAGASRPAPSDVILEIIADTTAATAASASGPFVRMTLLSGATRGARAVATMASAFTETYGTGAAENRQQRVSVTYIDAGRAPLSYTEYAITGVLVLAMMSAGLMTFAIALASIRQQNTFKAFACLPMPKGVYFGSLIIIRLLLILVSCALVLLFGRYVLGTPILHDPWQLPSLLLAILAGSLLFLSMGLLVGSRAKDPSSAAVTCNLIYFPMIFLADLTIPVDAFPPALQAVLSWLPASPVAGMVRGVLFEQQTGAALLQHLVMIVAWSTVLLFFTRTSFQSMVAGEAAR